MPNALLMAIGGGVLSALLYLSVTAGGLGTVILAYLGPLPLLMVGLGLGLRSFAIAGTVAVLAVAGFGGPLFGLSYGLANGIVVAVIVRQALLARPAPDGTLEWYPPGLLLVVLTGLGLVGLGLAALLTLGDPGGLEGSVRQFLSLAFGDAAAGTAGAEEPLGELIEGFAQVFPGMVVVSWLTMAIINAALAQGVLMRFGRNLRPAMRVAEVELPNWTPMLLAAAGVLALLGGEGQLGYLGLNAAIVLLVPFFFAGLAVVHAFAGGRQARTLLLMVFYFFLLVSGWPIAMVVGLGVIEQWAGLRRRFSRTGPDQES
ncbi:DUF2232 domain-containing protein [Skermanella mucosa]|uniref:DUF2232 domain-containing protein n=1 Tax=Skermanella mucosa TaxID=1789672 RepID=UPI00192BB3A5|nr:DUF2232 domain-containing protein [Skermanella mucosa]UEM22584.1 DUF2232 domain-containing protein [Skermanella mucosa]